MAPMRSEARNEDNGSMVGVREADRLFWRELLGGNPELTRIAGDCKRPEQLRDARLRFVCEEELSRLVQGRSGGSSYAEYVLMIGALSLVASRYAHADRVLIATPAFGEGQAGELPNQLLVMPVDLRASDNARAFLNAIKDTLRSVVDHQQYPFGRLAMEAGWIGGTGERLIVPIAAGLAGLNAAQANDNCAAELQFWFSFQADGQLQLELAYNARQYTEVLVSQLAAHWQSAIRLLCVNIDEEAALLEWLPAWEREQVIHQFNATEGVFPTEMTLHGLFERQAEMTPDALAAMYRDEQVTYRELDEWSNRIARTLRLDGVGPGTCAAVLCSRSPAMVAAVLGVLKAGGAYVPLDASWPKRRLETVLSEVGASHIVTMKEPWEPVADLSRRVRSVRRVLVLDEAGEAMDVSSPDKALMVKLFDDLAEAAADRVSAGGFISAYTGLPYTEQEVDQYVSRVAELALPYAGAEKSALEVGCGSGLIMFELAPSFGHYAGLDPSPVTQRRNEQAVRERGLDNVSLLTAFADSMADMEAGSFDLVLLPSVFQFFGGYMYAEQVLKEALRLLRPGGTLIIADVPDEESKETFRASLEEFRRNHGMVYQSRFQVDQHLYAHEQFFLGFAAQYPNVSVQVARRTGFKNELRYRCDVVLTLAGEHAPIADDIYVTGGRIARQSGERLAPIATSADTAYILFTSGSTGTPKGVVVNHRPVVNVIDWINGTFGVNGQDRLFFVTSLCFDLSVYDLFGMFAAGGAIDIVPDAEAKRPEGWPKRMAEAGITIWDSAPAALAQSVPWFEKQASENAFVRLALLSGDWIPLTLPNKLKELFPGIRVAALGGATEACIWSNAFEVGDIDPAWASIPYGRPIRNARYYILDRFRQPCPIGAIGELYIGGECLAAGYHNEAITQERFVDDPFVSKPGAVMYRTGDLAKWMRDGNIEFLGRTDHQVKIRGYRVELGEIQAKLLQHPGIEQCIVIDRADGSGVKSLCAYYAADEEQPVRALRDYLSGELPPYMIPSFFVRLDEIPITTNGKVDRHALPDPHTVLRAGDECEPPANEIEKELVELWKQLLEIEQVGVLDDFFEIGGHSLLAVKMELEMELRGLVISPEDFVQCKTVRDLAQRTTRLE